MSSDCLMICRGGTKRLPDYEHSSGFPCESMSAGDEGEERWGYSSGDSSESLDTNNNVLFWIATRIPTSLNHTSLPIFEDEARIDIDLSLYDLNPPQST